LAVEHGLPPNYSRRLQHSGLEGTLCAYVHERQEGLAVNDLRQQSPVDSNQLVALGFRAYAGIPLLHRQQALGTLSLLSREPNAPATHNMALLTAIGDQVATAVINARLFQTIVDERSRLQALIESSRDGIILIGMDRRVLVTNAPALELLRLPGQAQDWTNRLLLDALMALRHRASDVVRVTLAEMRRIERGDEVPGEGEYEVPPRTIHWLNLPVTANGTPLGRLLVLRDVTEERLVERIREDLTRAMVHDLRNPLTAIFGSLEILKLRTDNLSADQTRLLEIAASSTQGMLELVNKILDVSRLEGGHMPLHCAQVSLADVIAEVLGTQSSLAMDKGVRLETQVPPDLKPIWADAKLIARVLQNLVDNAIKFTPSGGLVRVSVSPLTSKTVGQAGGHAAAKTYLCVSVSDSGPGIPPELRSRLFQKFATGRQAGSGSGLGLAFCKLAVEAHEGQIWAEPEDLRWGSRSGPGTTLSFTLPLAGKSADTSETQVKTPNHAALGHQQPISAG
jgi:signal transduction histidine kinase